MRGDGLHFEERDIIREAHAVPPFRERLRKHLPWVFPKAWRKPPSQWSQAQWTLVWAIGYAIMLLWAVRY